MRTLGAFQRHKLGNLGIALCYIRSAIFFISFLLSVIVFLPMALLMSVLQPGKGQYSKTFSRFTINYLCRYILNIKFNFEGLENLPKNQSFIIASKHQSAIDCLLFYAVPEIPNLTMIVKKELLSSIPFAKRLSKDGYFVAIDRMSKKNGIKPSLARIQNLKDRQKTEIAPLIFPEGTRNSIAFDDVGLLREKKIKYKNGIFAFYNHLNWPVVPVALNTGFFWPRRSFIKYSGVITVKFCKPILQQTPPMLKHDFMTKLEKIIEKKSTTMIHDELFKIVEANKEFNIYNNDNNSNNNDDLEKQNLL